MRCFNCLNKSAFSPEETQQLSRAFDEVCRLLNLSKDATGERESIAVRIMELALRGERDADRLREQFLQEARQGNPAAAP